MLRTLLIVVATSVRAMAQNQVIFDNQSGEQTLVKLIGPADKEVEVGNGAKAEVDASAGKCIIKVRYGVPGHYGYTKGQEFSVEETATAMAHFGGRVRLHSCATCPRADGESSEAGQDKKRRDTR